MKDLERTGKVEVGVRQPPLRLVGRRSEMAALESAFQAAAAGSVRALLLLADPGLGKTRLAQELLSRKREGAVCLSARAYPLGATAAFGLWAEALERHLWGLGAERVRQLCGGALDDLGGLLTSVAAARATPPARDAPRLRVLQGLAIVLRTLGRSAPVVVFLDDLHLADAASLHALGFLARNLAGTRLLILGAVRPGQLAGNAVASEVLLSLEQEGLLSRLRLDALGRADLAELAQATLEERAPPEPLVDWLMDRSRGNPLFALGLLRALIDEGADLGVPTLKRFPEELSERVGVRLQGLAEPALVVLETLAVVGQRTSLGELIRLSGRPLERLAPILRQLVRTRLVAEREEGSALDYELTHPLIQEAVYHRIGGARRRALHRLVARALLAARRLSAAAPHFARSAEPGEPEAIDALLGALREAEQRDLHRETMTILGYLCDLLPPGDRRWLRVLDEMSWSAEWVIDHRADAITEPGVRAMLELERVLEGSGDHARQAAVQFRLSSFLAWGRGDLPEARRAGLRARLLFEKAGQPSSARIAANALSWLHGLAGDLAGQAAAAAAVLSEAEAVGDRLGVVQSLSSLGWARAWLGDLAQARTDLRRVASIADAEGRPYRSAWSLSWLGFVSALGGQLEEATRLFEETRAKSSLYADTVVLELEALVNWMRGRFRPALGCWQESAAWNLGGLSLRRAWGMGVAAMAASELGEAGAARRLLESAERVHAGSTGAHMVGPFVHWAAGTVAFHGGDLDRALTELARATSEFLIAGAWPAAAFPLADLSEVAAAAAQPARAEAAAGELEAIARRAEPGPYRGLAGLAAAWARQAAGQPAAAAEAARAALGRFAGSGYDALEARAADALGTGLASVDRSGAVPALERAAELYRRCAAGWRLKRTLQALSRLGHPGRRAAAAALGPGALTNRQRDVAVLAARGHTAREIGRRLFIGDRTVETHLADVYAKLGVASRRELILRAAELGL